MTAPSTLPPLLDIRNLHFAYPGEPPIASGWTLGIGPGVTLMYGDTGTGKTTLIRVLAGELPATAGDLVLAGKRLPGAPAAYREHLFFIEPSTRAFDAMTVRECTDALRGDAPFDVQRWQGLVEGFSLVPHLEKNLFMLSTGSKRKVWLAAMLASDKPLTLLDEPTGGLDAGSILCLWSTLAELASEGRRAIVVASGQPFDGVPLAGVIELPLRPPAA